MHNECCTINEDISYIINAINHIKLAEDIQRPIAADLKIK